MISRREQIKEGLQDWLKGQTPIDTAQNYADIVGMIPGIGNIVDFANAGVDVLQGDYGDAGVRAAQGIPIIGIPAALAGDYVKDAVTNTVNQMRNKPTGDTPAEYDEYAKSMFGDKEEKSKGGKKDPEAGRAAASAFGNMFNTRLVTPGAFSTFGESTEVLSEAIPFTKFLKSKDAKVKAQDKLDIQQKGSEARRVGGYDPNTLLNRRGKLLPAMALTGLGLGATIAVPKIFGGANEVRGGQPLSVGAHSGAVATQTFDKLQSLSAFVPQYNPAAFALNALSNRVTGQMI
jgi:hypothetical protein